VRLIQALRKLGKSTLVGFNTTTSLWGNIETKALLESDQRWISERVGFNARRVLLTEHSLDPYRVIKISNDDIKHIIYSEQRAIGRGAAFLYDYTILDETDEAQSVTFTMADTASGMGGDKTETLSDAFPVHMVRYASTSSEEQDHVQFSRLYAFLPGDITVTEDQELSIGPDRYIITEAVTELLCLRLSLTKR